MKMARVPKEAPKRSRVRIAIWAQEIVQWCAVQVGLQVGLARCQACSPLRATTLLSETGWSAT